MLKKIILVLLSFTFLSTAATVAQDSLAKSYFNNWLNECPVEEIRCLWLRDNSYQCGMTMQFDLSKYSVTTVREVYDHASQGDGTRTLSHVQILSLKKILAKMPKPTSANTSTALYIATNIKGNVKIFTYKRTKLPLEIMRLYDIGGGWVELIGKSKH